MSTVRHIFLPHHTNNQRARILHPTALIVIMGIFTVFQYFITQATYTLPDILGYASQIAPTEIVRLTNIQRSNGGASPVKLDGQLSAAAARKAADMFAKNYWAHNSPSGTQPWFFITESGYAYRYAGENLARDFSDPKSVVDAWMNSPTHRDNLLNNRYEDIGVAVVDGKLDGRETTLVVQMFGTKLSSAPTVSRSSALAVQAQEEPPAPAAAAVPTSAPVPTTVPLVPTPVAELQPQQEAVVSQTPSPRISPFTITRTLAFSLLGIFGLVLGADVLIVEHKKIARWTSKSFAHFIFIGAILIAMATVLRGQII